jgi:hypothetical protein
MTFERLVTFVASAIAPCTALRTTLNEIFTPPEYSDA